MGVGAAGMRENVRTWRGIVGISGPFAACDYDFARAVGGCNSEGWGIH